MTKQYRSGFFTVIGRPNVGKSTLVNALVGQKITITSSKAQTTRHRIQGVLNFETGQAILLDTPGLHKPQDKMSEYLINVAQTALTEVDGIIFVVDGATSPGKGDRFIAERIKKEKVPVLIVLNKSDLVSNLGNRSQEYSKLLPNSQLIAVSALGGTNLALLKKELFDLLKPGPQYFPDDMITDQPERVLVGEMIREKALELTQQEIPYSVAVEINKFERRSNQDLIDIYATIFIERDSQKGIIIGKGGHVLKTIGVEARKDIEQLLGTPIYLDLWVKVKKDWRDREEEMRRLGYQR